MVRTPEGCGSQLRSHSLFYPSAAPGRTAIPCLTCKLVIKIIHERLSTPNSPHVTRLPENSVFATALTSPAASNPSQTYFNCGELINSHHFERRRHLEMRSATRIETIGMLNDFEAECMEWQATLT